MQCDRHLTGFGRGLKNGQRVKLFGYVIVFIYSTSVLYIRNYRYPHLFYESVHVKKNTEPYSQIRQDKNACFYILTK